MVVDANVTEEEVGSMDEAAEDDGSVDISDRYEGDRNNRCYPERTCRRPATVDLGKDV